MDFLITLLCERSKRQQAAGEEEVSDDAVWGADAGMAAGEGYDGRRRGRTATECSNACITTDMGATMTTAGSRRKNSCHCSLLHYLWRLPHSAVATPHCRFAVLSFAVLCCAAVLDAECV